MTYALIALGVLIALPVALFVFIAITGRKEAEKRGGIWGPGHV
jgi:hypothetical protein